MPPIGRRPKPGFRSARSLAIGLLLLPLTCFWAQEQIIDSIFSLMVPPVILTLCVALLSAPLRRRWPTYALGSGELMLVYAMQAVACAISTEWMEMTAPNVYGFALYADQNPRYGQHILPYLSPWFFFKDAAALNDLRSGGQPLRVIFAALPLWMPKVMMWTLLLTLLTTAMLCINTLLREQWIHQEKLSFPIAQVPLALMGESGGAALGRSRLFWVAFAATFAIDLNNGLAFLYPSIPPINIGVLYDLSQAFSTPPWNQTGWTPISLFPFLSALGFFMPTDLLFSLLFFFFVRKTQQMVAFSLGHEQGTFGGGGLVPTAPYLSEQSWGAFLGLFAMAMWLARPHWKKVWNAILDGEDGGNAGFSYRFLFVLLLLCLGGMAGLGLLLGLPPLFVLAYTLLFLMFSVAVTRLRAQLGAPTHEMAFMGPHQILIDFHGTAGLPEAMAARTMTAFHFMNRLHRDNPMPSQMEGLYLAERTCLSPRRMFTALVLAAALGSLLSFLIHVFHAYQWLRIPWVSNEAGGVAAAIQETPHPPNAAGIAAVIAGILVVLALSAVRFRFPGFYLHPAGYALAMNFGVDIYWFGLLLVLITKVFVQRFYGLKGYGKLREMAIGLILGEFAAETIWAILSMANGRMNNYSISFDDKAGWGR